jgi:HD superfamily phosphodiesterase
MIAKCPGSQNFSQPKPENVACPFCSYDVEIWTDEVKATCPKCKRTFLREGEQSCLDWCAFAKECLGEALFGTYMRNKTATLKQKLLKELEDHFGNDAKRIGHAKKVMGYAEELLKEGAGDWHIVIPASILHDIGIKTAEEKYGSSKESYQEKEGARLARKILLKYGFKKKDIEEICEIISHHHRPGKVNTDNFKVLYDADMLVNLKDAIAASDEKETKTAIEKAFLTRTGKQLAQKVYSAD